MDYLNDYIGECIGKMLFTLPPIFLFLGGYYVNRLNYHKNNIILKNIERIKLDVDDVKSREYKNLKNEIKKLKEGNEKFLNKIEELSLIIIDKNKRITEYDKKIEEYYGLKIKMNYLEEKPQPITTGNGGLRDKNEEGTIYYHGMGHLEKKYVWWEPYMSRKMCEYTNQNRKVKFPEFETHSINDFCNNFEYCIEINKNKRNIFYYECKGHKINVD